MSPLSETDPAPAPSTEDAPPDAEAIRSILELLRRDAHEGPLRLAGARLIDADLSGLDLSGGDFRGADLSRANFEGAILVGVNFEGATLYRACLNGCELAGAKLNGANLTGAALQRAGLGRADLSGANLIEADLSDASLVEAKLERADLSLCTLEGLRAKQADWRGARLVDANLRGAELDGGMVHGARLDGADLSGASLRGIKDFDTASWLRVDIREIDFTGAYLCRNFILDQNYLEEFRSQSHGAHVLYLLWSLTSDCGRSTLRWALCTGALVVAFALAYTQVDVEFGPHATAISPLYFSVVTMTTLGYGDVLPTSVAAQWVVMVQVVCGYVMLGGLLSIFSSKMARRAD